MKLADLLPVANLLERLGDDLLQWRDRPKERHILAPAEFKTAADVRAHERIAAGLKKIFPGLPVLSEEEAWLKARPELYWLIDPIDGTASWYEGFSGFATQAALIREGQPIYGIVHAPALGVTWEGALLDDERGAWRNGVPLPRLHPSERMLLCDNYPQPRRAAKLLHQRLPVTGYAESGSLGIKCCLVADGTADLFVKDVTVRDWDIAPAAPALAYVGAFLSLPDGKSYNFNGLMEKPSGVLVARDADLAQRAVNVLSTERNRYGKNSCCCGTSG
jgi:3'(2'), 5'-bisphosphate nucleotidase